MADIIDILTIPLDECEYFTVNNLVDFVPQTSPPVGNRYLSNTGGGNLFVIGDSLLIISAGFLMPEGFTIWKNPADNSPPLTVMQLLPYGNSSGHLYTSPNFTANQVYIPMENFETVLNSYLDCRLATDTLDPTKTLLTEPYTVKCFINVLLTSMMNVPASMNGKEFRIVPFVKVLHSYPMSAV